MTIWLDYGTAPRRKTVDLTTEMLERFIRGQIEIQNRNEGYLFRGEIDTIAVEGEGDDAELKVSLNWMAKGEGFPQLAPRWVAEGPLVYDVSLMIYSVSDINQGRIMLFSPIVGETTVLYPMGGSRIDPSEVEGLVLTT